MRKRIAWDEAELRHLYASGLTQAEIAERFGIDQPAVCKAFRRFGIVARVAAPRPGIGAGSKNPGWRGGRHLLNGTYTVIYAPDHPCANKQGYVMEHVAVAYEKYGHAAPFGHVTHHINMRQWDNRPENLAYITKRAHHLMHRQFEQFAATLLERGVLSFDVENGYQVVGAPVLPLLVDEQRPCEHCGEAFRITTKRPRQRFCSRGCVAGWRRGRARTEWAHR